MSLTRIGIIGSAGRREDAQFVTKARYNTIVRYVQDFIQQYDSIELVSGGAAFIDHVAVSTFLMNYHKQGKHCSLTLHLPTTFNSVTHSYRNDNVGNIANYYHHEFSKQLSKSPNHSLNTLTKLIESQKEENLMFMCYTYNGFKERNIAIANQVDILLAFTAYEGNEPKPRSGTLHTWYATSDYLTRIHHDLRNFD